MNRPTFPLDLARALSAIPEAWGPGMLRLRCRPPGSRALDECGGDMERAIEWLRTHVRMR